MQKNHSRGPATRRRIPSTALWHCSASRHCGLDSVTRAHGRGQRIFPSSEHRNGRKGMARAV